MIDIDKDIIWPTEKLCIISNFIMRLPFRRMYLDRSFLFLILVLFWVCKNYVLKNLEETLCAYDETCEWHFYVRDQNRCVVSWSFFSFLRKRSSFQMRVLNSNHFESTSKLKLTNSHVQNLILSVIRIHIFHGNIFICHHLPSALLALSVESNTQKA